MQDFIYTTQGVIAKSDILESFVSTSEIIDGEDLYGRTVGVISLDESIRGKCDFSSCRINKPENFCKGLKKKIVLENGTEVKNGKDGVWDLNMSTCKVSCDATGNTTEDAKGCLCKTYTDKKDGKTIRERCESRSVDVSFSDNRRPCLVWDEGTKQMKVNTSITGCKPTTEGFKQDEDQDDPLLPFFDQRLFRPSWSVLK